MTEMDTGLRRRATDFQLHPDPIEELYPGQDRRQRDRRERRTQRRSSARAFLRKFRQPIIGLTIAGAAAPFTLATQTQQPKASEAQPTEADLAREAAKTDSAGERMDAEDQVASKIATETQTTEQSSVVQTAVDRYGIDQQLASDIYDVAQREGINPRLAYGLVHTESSFRTHAKSGVGARGLTQVMPKTARWLMPGTKADDLWQQRTNLTLGFRYLNQLIDRYHGDVHHALTAYNRGPGTVDRILKRGGDPDNGYAGKVIGSGLGGRG